MKKYLTIAALTIAFATHAQPSNQEWKEFRSLIARVHLLEKVMAAWDAKCTDPKRRDPQCMQLKEGMVNDPDMLQAWINDAHAFTPDSDPPCMASAETAQLRLFVDEIQWWIKYAGTPRTPAKTQALKSFDARGEEVQKAFKRCIGQSP
jgi:hypothetical protein